MATAKKNKVLWIAGLIGLGVLLLKDNGGPPSAGDNTNDTASDPFTATTADTNPIQDHAAPQSSDGMQIDIYAGAADGYNQTVQIGKIY